MPSSFARNRVKVKFQELVTALEVILDEERGNAPRAKAIQDILDRVTDAQSDFETMGNPQSGSSG